MKAQKFFFFLLVLILVSGCVKQQTRLSSSLQVSEFNSLASQYYPRPTFVSLNTSTSDKQSLLVVVDPYKPRDFGMKSSISFGEDDVSQYLSFVDKYFEWEQLAMERGDQFEKEIGKASDGTKVLTLYFKFYSGNERNHYLVVSTCDWMCVENSDHHYYDSANAAKLKRLLIQLRDNELEATDIDATYK